MAQEFELVERLILIAPAFNMMGLRAQAISPERRHAWHTAGWMPWDDEPLHKDCPLSWKWVEESEAYWKTSFDRLRPVSTTILHGLQDTVILPAGQPGVCPAAVGQRSVLSDRLEPDSGRPSTQQSGACRTVSSAGVGATIKEPRC